ncbi:MexW/MexI family multidrug efflux RND transporter permease subunit [Thauera butanivorans]|uniref:MexW/MexI family multidrug efflux RND transporter permease subunit n=1 Tax=Thauera butanivorans TaxID=86174 RepID=UPI003AB26E0D
MKFTDVFVRRPVLALVASSLIVLLGLFALGKLPIRQYPTLETSTITVSTEYPGASAELMQGFVTQPITQTVSSVEGIDYLSSSSVQGRSTVTLRMELNRDSTQALTETMAKVNQVRYRLPERAYDPVIELSAGDSTAVAYVGFSTGSLSAPELTDYLSRVVEPLFSGIPGVAKVQTFGGQRLAMRLWLDADRLAGRGLTASDVAEAVRRNNYQAAPGQVRGQYVIANVRVDSELSSVDEFRDLVIRNDGNGLVRLRDVGTVELGAAATNASATMDGEAAVHLGLFPTPAGNPLVIVDGIRQLLPEIEKALPPGVKMELAYETARFIEASIDEVLHTLLEAVLIVVLVIWLCLGSLRSVVIPVLTIPLSMLGAAGLMLAFGFSINLLTLLAMVLAIGLVVDDAIVVVENVHRHIEEGRSPIAAALIGAREIAGPVIAMTLTLAAVYAPIGLIGGLTGALFREFALTLAGAVIVSGVVALTLSPVMSSLLLKSSRQDDGHGRMARLAEQVFGGLADGYGKLLRFSLRQRWLSGGVALLVCLSLPLLYQMPQRELAPPEDQAAVLAAIKSPQYASLDYAERFGLELHRVMAAIPETTGTWIINGTDGPASSFGGINLSDWGARERKEPEILAELQQAVGDIEGSSIFAFQVAPLPGGSGGLPVQLVLRSAQDHPVIYEAMAGLKQRARESGLFVVVDSDLEYDSPVVQLTIDRAKAGSLGISMQDIGDSLGVLVGENYINRFALFGRSYDVIPQSMRDQRLTPQALARQFVRTGDGTLVPLSTVLRLEMGVEPNRLMQFDQQNAATLQAIPAPGVSLGRAVGFLEQAVADLPPGFSHDWQSESRQYVQEGNALVFAFLAALVVIYLVLAAQYESLADPLIILITVPLSICGALLPLALGWATLNIYTQIGLVTLIGLISKHGILMVEFANELQANEGLDRTSAIIRAAQIRLRPVLMTTSAMAFGVVPLLFASGAGANSRFGLGVVIVCGMLVGTLFTLFVLPTIYTWLARDHRVQSARELQLAGIAEIERAEGAKA